MPVPLRTTHHKAEVKYNVTTEFPSLGLHSAAATGNLGLVEYALDHGQPINSVLDGVLPLHAACAGGNVQVVRLLIDHGADVNAPRLPRRYSNDKNRDASAPIVGTSGSTPLHFAAANGNTEVVTVLLLHGAHADRPDKHGVTPEILARQNGWVECAQVLKDWILNKDRDLREREERTTTDAQTTSSTKRGLSGSPFQDIDTSPPPSRRRLHVKQSIDTALNMLKSSSSSHTDGRLTAPQGTPPSSPQKPLVEYTFYPADDEGPVHPGSRRPSLPHIMQPPADEPSPNYKHPSLKGISDERRPRSAGTGADRLQDHDMMYAPYGRGGSARKLGSKYSLLNIFKKAHHGDGTESPQPDSNLAREPSDSDLSPLSGSALTLPLSSSYNSSSAQQSNIDLHDQSFVQTNTPSSSSSPFSRAGFRFHRSSDASSKVRTPSHLHQPQFPPQTQPSPSPSAGLQRSPPLATEIHDVLVNQRPRSRSDASVTDQSDIEGLAGSNSSPLSPLQTGRVDASITLDDSKPLPPVGILDDDSADFGTNPDMGSGKTSPRPGILRSRNHSPSVGQGTIPPRALRFDSTSSGSADERKGKDSGTESPRRGELRSSNSASSLRTSKLRDLAQQHERAGSPSRVSSHADGQVYNSVHSLIEGAQQNDSTYRLPIHCEDFGPIVDMEGSDDLKPPTALLLRERGTSFTNSSQSSLSPILSNENPTEETRADFPFSINRPVPLVHQEDEGYLVPQSHLAVPTSQDNRSRGDSLSSNSTADSSVYPQLSVSGTTASGSSVTISTPGAGSYLALLPSSKVGLEEEYHARNLGKESSFVLGENLSVESRGLERRSNLNERRFHHPLGIDISTISSHAQAEALVQRARQDVLDLANGQEDSPTTASTGRTPLSARLAAYGESLALERKLRQQVEAQDDAKKSHTGDVISPRSPLTPDDSSLTPVSNKKSRDGVERQLSLEHKSGASKIRLRARDPRRPSTAEGLSSRGGNFFFNDQTGPLHPASRSTSVSGRSRSTLIADGMPAPKRMQSPAPISTEIHPDSPDLVSVSQSALERESLSRVSSLDGLDTETDSTHTLRRVPTAPAAGSGQTRGKREQVRSAKKLTRMGFSPVEQVGRTPAPSGTRFGAIKSIMQTFKGKT